MELLSNLIWAAVAIALWAMWLAGRRYKTASLLPRLAVQLTALSVLTVVLLPVISVTDDLQACHNPAEVERSLRRSTLHSAPDAGPQNLPVALALLVACFRAPYQETSAFLSFEEGRAPRTPGSTRALWSRPPPAA